MSDSIKYPFLDLKAADLPFKEEMVQAAKRVIESGRYIGGEEVVQLEASLCSLFQAPHAAGVANGLDALRLALRACIIEGVLHTGDEVIVPANTYIASVLAVTDAGLTPILVDPDYTTMCLSGECVEEHITERTRAIMPVHLYGRIAWDETLRDIAITHKLLIIEDAAQSIGACADVDGLFGSRWAGAIGHIGAFSFYPTKNIGAVGDAGAVMTHIQEIAATVRALANYGSDTRYHNLYQGFNSRLDPIQAAMLQVKLTHLSSLTDIRRQIASTYSDNISNPLVSKPSMAGGELASVWHQYVVRTPRRDHFRSYLSAHGVATDIHYATPPHLQPCYANLPHAPLPITERIAGEVVSLPITPGCTTAADAREIAQIINQYV